MEEYTAITPPLHSGPKLCTAVLFFVFPASNANHSSDAATDRPSPPEGPVETVETTSSVIEIQWKPPKDDGGAAVTNYTIQRQQAGQNLWTNAGDISAEKTSFRDRNVTHGKKYNYRICAENSEGVSEALETTDSIMAGVMSECRAKNKALFASPHQIPC